VDVFTAEKISMTNCLFRGTKSPMPTATGALIFSGGSVAGDFVGTMTGPTFLNFSEIHFDFNQVFEFQGITAASMTNVTFVNGWIFSSSQNFDFLSLPLKNLIHLGFPRVNHFSKIFGAEKFERHDPALFF
jgi:hypothetical protein